MYLFLFRSKAAVSEFVLSMMLGTCSDSNRAAVKFKENFSLPQTISVSTHIVISI